MNCVKYKLAHDLYYVRNVSIWLDLRIAFCTPCHFLASAIEVTGRSLLQPCHRSIRVDAVSVEFADSTDANAKNDIAA
jgi:hypothetical protein